MSPLEGLKVVELANILAGPLIGQFCAELGADVIKVEQPGSGDPTRGWRLATESGDSDVCAYFAAANWGKRSIALDIGTPDGQAVVHDLVRAADVVVMAYKPGDEVKFKVDYATLAALNPALIHMQITAYGNDDPRPGFDAIIQAESGFTLLNGEADGPPVKMPVALMDLLAAHQLKEGLLLALLKRERTGEGSHVTTSLLAAATASLANQASNYLIGGVIPRRMGSEHPNIAPYGSIFATADARQVVLAVGTERQFEAFAQSIGAPDLATDPRFAGNAARVRHREALDALIRERLGALDAADLEQRLGSAKVPFGFVNDMPAVFAQPASAAQLFDGGQGVRSVALTGDIEGRRQLSPPPHLDADRDAILEALRSGGWR